MSRGKSGLREYLENLETTQHVRAYVFNENMEEISHRGAPDWAVRVAGWRPQDHRAGIHLSAPPPVLRESRASSDGLTSTPRIGAPPGPRLFLGPRGLPVPGLIICRALFRTGLLFPRLVYDQAGGSPARRHPATGRWRSHGPRRRSQQPPARRNCGPDARFRHDGRAGWRLWSKLSRAC